MAGLIIFSEDEDWSAPGWMFYWVIDFISQNTKNTTVATYFKEISDENLGSVDLTELNLDERREVIDLIRTSLSHAAEDLLARRDRKGDLEIIDELTKIAESEATEH